MTIPRYVLLENHPSFVQRMFVLEELVGNKSKLAARAGISNSGLRHYFFGKGEPTRPQLIALALAAGVHVSWLVTGEGPMRPVSSESKAFITDAYMRYRNSEKPDDPATRIGFVKAYNNRVIAQAPDIHVLSLYELNQWLTEYAAATPNGADYLGPPFYNLDDLTGDLHENQNDVAASRETPLCIRRTIAIDRWKLDAEASALVAVSADDLHGPFRPHDWVLCDRRKSDSPRSGIYLIHTPDGYVFRRVQYLDRRRFRIIREPHPSSTADKQVEDAMEAYNPGDVELLGRAVGYWRRVRT